MKHRNYVVAVAIIAFGLSLNAFAKDKDSGNFTVDDTVQVGATQLAPGNYKAEWSGPANALQIDILQHGKTVATAEGKLKDLQHPAPYSSVLVKPTAQSQKTLSEIDFDHKNEALVLGGE